jgi:DNA-binding NarL/FixJ family response regulator
MQIILCTKSKTLLFHWLESLNQTHKDILHVKDKIELESKLKNDENILLLFDSKFTKEPKDDIAFYLSEYPKLKILFLEDIPSYKNGKQLLPLGIKGYGNTRMAKTPLNQAIEIIKSGNVWLYPEFMQELIKDVTPTLKHETNTDISSLTKKELEVAKLVANGLSNQEIAEKLSISPATIKVHLRSIFSKLHVKDRLSLALHIKNI